MRPQKTSHIFLSFLLMGWLLFNMLPTADGFIAFDHRIGEKFERKMNNLIRRVHKKQWVIGYVYAGTEWGSKPHEVCPPEARKNGKAIETAITAALRAWLQPVGDLNTGKPVVSDFRYVPDVVPQDASELNRLYDLTITFFCDFGQSFAATGPDGSPPPHIKMHRGTDVDQRFENTLLHEIGHSFGLLDTYRRAELHLEELRVSRGGLLRTIGHQPSSVMCEMHISRPGPRRIGQDDKDGIVWLYKFYHENLPLEDCIFPDYELERSPDGCRPKSPLIFEIKYGPDERFALKVMDEDRNTDINAQDETGSTALHYALEKGYSGVVKKLISHSDLNVNARNAEGSTALFWAAKRGLTVSLNNFSNTRTLT